MNSTFTGLFPQDPEVSTFKGTVIPPSVRPVLILAGTDYDMGTQHVHQLVDVYGESVLEAFSREFSPEERGALLEVLAYVRTFAPEWEEQFQGMSDASRTLGVVVSPLEILAKYTGFQAFDNFATPSDPEAPVQGCTGFAAWGTATRDGRVIASSSWDSDPTAFEYVIMAYPKSGHAYTCNAFIGAGVSGPAWFPGVNAMGVAYVHHGSGQAGGEKTTIATIGQPLYIGHTLRFADSAEAALRMQLGYAEGAGVYPFFGTNTGGLWVDASGDGFVIESRSPEIVRRAGDNGEKDALYSTNNSLASTLKPVDAIRLVKELGWDLEFVPHGGWEGMNEDAVKRNLFIFNMVSNYAGVIDREFVKMMWRFTGNAPDFETYEAAVASLATHQGQGWDSKIAALDNAAIFIIEPAENHESVMHIVNGPLSPNTHEIPDFSFWIPGALHAGYDIKLAGSTSGVLSDAYGRAMTALVSANRHLRTLHESHPRRSELRELFDTAVKHWYVATNFKDASANGANPDMRSTGKSLRSFARSQAIANSVSSRAEQEPSRPEDLGLKPYWGNWGEWQSWKGSR